MMIWESMIDSAVGPCIGVLLGFMINYCYIFHNNQKRASTYRDSIKKELRYCMDLLGESKGKLLPTDNWDTLVASGSLWLLGPEEVNKLCEIYHKIRSYNYEAKRTRDLAEMSRNHPDNKIIFDNWKGASSKLGIISDELKKIIGDFIEKA